MPLAMEEGLSQGDVVLGGDRAPTPQKGAETPCLIFGPCQLWPNGCKDEDGTRHWGGPWSKPHCARQGPSSPA